MSVSYIQTVQLKEPHYSQLQDLEGWTGTVVKKIVPTGMKLEIYELLTEGLHGRLLRGRLILAEQIK